MAVKDNTATGLLEGDLNDTEEHRRAVYALFKAGDERFDGRVFVGVSSTGVYCRPVCRVKMPKFENCTFYHSAAEAEAAGFRPCMLCRPELAPGLSSADARASLARRAAELLRERCSSGESVEHLAGKLGYTDRHLRRVFEDEFGVTPVQYLQTCRLLLAKSLLTDTRIPVAQVTVAAGFGSVRRFNHLFKERYRLTPTQLRKRKPADGGQGITLHLAYRPPYGFAKLLVFFRARQLDGVEVVDGDSYTRAVRMEGAAADGGDIVGWIRVTDEPAKGRLAVRMSETLLPVASQVAARVRRQFDTDCDPDAVHEGIRSLDELVPGAAVPGTRVPGAFDPFEIAVRAVLGQQISVQAANKLAARIAAAYGTPVDFEGGGCGEVDGSGPCSASGGRGEPDSDGGAPSGLRFLFPTARDFLALDPIEDALGELGVIKTRSRTIQELARLAVEGGLDLGPGADVARQMETLLAVRGIGPWSANYIAMRALGYTDAFLEKDAGIKHALPDLTPAERLAAAERWRPWRAYANLCLWNSLG